MKDFNNVEVFREKLYELLECSDIAGAASLFRLLNDFLLSGEYLTCDVESLFRGASVLPDPMNLDDLESRPKEGARNHELCGVLLVRIYDALLHIHVVSVNRMEYDNESRTYEVDPNYTINHTLDSQYADNPVYRSVKEWRELSVPLVRADWQLHAGKECLSVLLKLYSRLSSDAARWIPGARGEYERLRSMCTFLLYKWFNQERRRVYGGYLLQEQDRLVLLKVNDIESSVRAKCDQYQQLYDVMYHDKRISKPLAQGDAVRRIVEIKRCVKEGRVRELKRFCDQYKDTWPRKDAGVDREVKVRRYAHATQYGYAFNSYVSVKLQQEGVSLHQVRALHREVLDFQDKCRIWNYHPHMSLLEHISQRFEREDFDMEDGQAWVQLCKSALKEYSNGLQWCQDHQFAPFFFTPGESGALGDVFIASAFARLIDYENLRQKEDEYRHALSGFQERLRLHTIVQVHSEELKRMQTRNLQHMAIFSAVISVIVTAASAASGSSGLEVAREVLLDAGVVLVLFLLLLFLLLESGAWRPRCRWIAWAALAAILCVLLALR